ncbi:MAG: thioredoxin domain-containing protein, partial [Pyrinomonadaceae bacterium]
SVSMKKALPIIIILVVLGVALGGTALLLKSPSATPSAPASAPGVSPTPQTAVTSSTPSTAQSADEKPFHIRGRADAPVLIEEFGDFQCPPCGQFHPIMTRIEKEFPTQVRFGFRHFPIRSHRHAVLAAHAAEAAGLQGKFWEMHDLIYDKQREWSEVPAARPIFTEYAKQLGLNTQKFFEDIDGTRASMRLVLDERRAQAVGVTGTPTVFVNGREIPFETLMSYDALRGVVNAELAKAQQ